MFIKTIKLKRPKAGLIGMVICAVVLLAAVIITACRVAGKPVYEMKSESQRQAFLKEMGWEVSEEYDECKAIEIPKEFNDVYKRYNDLQKQQGFDLEKYKGETAEVYTYRIKNYDDSDTEVKADLIVCKGQLIGGDVCSTELDGFMHGFFNSHEHGHQAK